MKKESAQMMKAPRPSAQSREQQVAAPAMDGLLKPTKRKASPDTKACTKRTKNCDSESQNTMKEDLRVRVLKRKVLEDGEGPSEEVTKKRRVEASQEDLESASTDTDKDGSNKTALDDASKRGHKRKSNADGEGPSRKKRALTKRDNTEDLSASLQAKYEQGEELGAGGCGCVFAGYRRADNLPVAIKHIPKDNVWCKHTDQTGRQVSIEVAVMERLASGNPGSVGTSASVSLLDWYDLEKELVLVLERPVPSKDLLNYVWDKGGALQEEEAKIIMTQLVDAAKELKDNMIFHRDIKVENILIESGSAVPRVRLIDFGLSCFVKQRSLFHSFYGTADHKPPEWYERYAYKAGPTTVWQLGVVLYECLHKRASFETKKFLEKRLKINKRLSKDGQDFLRRCLTTAPEERSTLEEMKLHPCLFLLPMMAEIMMCEPLELYNLLNQRHGCVSRLAEINYLCLVDARQAQDYQISHILTARNAKVDSGGTFLLPVAVEVDSMQHVVVYDSNTSCLEEQGRAVDCARAFAQGSLYPVKILRGGFERFSALYTFLRTEKMIYTILELENLKTYPVEIIAGLLYMGDQNQSLDSSILKNLKISAVICFSESDSVASRSIKGNPTILNVPAVDSAAFDLYSSFEKICSFIHSNINIGSRVLIVSERGRSRCSAVTIAFLMHHHKRTLREAWRYMCKCKPAMRPNTGFLQQLSDWELHTMGTKVTDTCEPCFEQMKPQL